MDTFSTPTGAGPENGAAPPIFPPALQPAREETAAHNLPAPVTRFVGRQDELRSLQNLLRNERLVTLVGPGGSGKTRLAIQAAWQALGEFADGVWLVPLMAVTSPDLFYFAISEALQLPAYSSLEPHKQIINYLRSKHLLLVLDNFEQLIPVAGLLPVLLQQAPRVTILVTSRERLNLYGECAFDLAGLDVPQNATPEDLAASGAGQLFWQNAQRARPGFAFSPENSPSVQRICHLVEGMPLALELAGTWARTMSCQQIAAQIENDLDFLTAGWQDQPQRRRSLRTLLEHSWGMLTPGEQQTLRRLSLLAGHFDLPAAQAVAQVDRPELIALMDKSQLYWDSGSERYDSHPLLKRYAAERLAEDPVEQAEISARHSRYFLEFVGQRQEALRGPHASRALHEIGEALNDIRQAWDWAVEKGRDDWIEISMEGMRHFYETRAWYPEGAEIFRRAAEQFKRPGETAPNARRLSWRLLARQAVFLSGVKNWETASNLLGECLTAQRAAGDTAEIAFCLSYLGSYLVNSSQFSAARAYLVEALELARSTGLSAIEARTLIALGRLYSRQGEMPEAEIYYEQARQIYRELGNLRGEATTYYNIGWVLLQRGYSSRALACFQHSYEISVELADLSGQCNALDSQASLLRGMGRLVEALEQRQKVVALILQTGRRRAEGVAYSNLANDWVALGNLEKARPLLEQGQAIYRETGSRWDESIGLLDLSRLYNLQGEFQFALEAAQQALQIAVESAERVVQGLAQMQVAESLLRLGRLSEAHATFQTAWDLLAETGQEFKLAEARAGMARLALVQNDLQLAFSHAEAIWQTLHGAEAPADENFALHQACWQVFLRTRDARGGEVVRAAYRALQERAERIPDPNLREMFFRLPLHRELLREFAALEEGEARKAAETLKVSALPDPLTRQEIEVLRLLANGLSNQQIATSLTITVGTVKSHVHNIYCKLNAQNRTQAVARGREMGLL
jgi:predicted ATPase/DNA-binding CsgD family transcriptional regulator